MAHGRGRQLHAPPRHRSWLEGVICVDACAALLAAWEGGCASQASVGLGYTPQASAIPTCMEVDRCHRRGHTSIWTLCTAVLDVKQP